MKKWISALSVVGALSLASAANAQDDVSAQCAAGEKCTAGDAYIGPYTDEMTCNTAAGAEALQAATNGCASHGGVNFYNGYNCTERPAAGSGMWYSRVTYQCND